METLKKKKKSARDGFVIPRITRGIGFYLLSLSLPSLFFLSCLFLPFFSFFYTFLANGCRRNPEQTTGLHNFSSCP